MATMFLMSDDKETIKRGFSGFSWTMLLFGAFVPLLRKDWSTFFVMLLFHFASGFLPNLFLSFFYNRAYTGVLLARGFKATDKTGELLIQEMKPVHTSFALKGVPIWARIVMALMIIGSIFFWGAILDDTTSETNGPSAINSDGSFNKDVMKERSLQSTCETQFDLETQINQSIYQDSLQHSEIREYLNGREKVKAETVEKCIENLRNHL